MRSLALFVVLSGLVPAVASAQFSARIGPRGEIAEVKVGDTVYFTDVALAIMKPGWSGNIVDQRALDPAQVRIAQKGPVTTYTATLAGDNVRVRLREEVTVAADKVTIQYELVPEQDVQTQSVVLQGLLATATHAGKTRYFVADNDAPQRGTCPGNVNADRYVIYSGSPEWIGFAAPGAGALRVVPTDCALQFQDNRKWNAPQFALQATAGGGKLAAAEPLRFAISFRADTAEQLATEAQRRGQANLAGLKQSDDRRLAIGKLVIDQKQVPVFSPIELSADIAATYANPFDPEEIAVDAEITRPDGRSVTVPGFYLAPMVLETKRGTERLRLNGPAGFRVRYTPVVAGKHRVVLQAKDKSGIVKSDPGEFTATPAQAHGFIRIAKGSPRFFAFDDGKPYFAIGENVCWANGRTPLANYTSWFQGLGKAGGNWARLWLAFNEKGLEWVPAPTPKPGTGTYQGLGKYALDNAWRLDEVVRLARENGISLMFCLGTYGEFTEGGYFHEGSWPSNPYNAKNGGPCAKPADFWTNGQARKLYKQRLRYIIARWGFSPNVFAWEFWNEVPATPETAAWVAEMAAYFKKDDVNRHLVSTTYGNDAIWQCRDVDFTMNHIYGQAGHVADFTDRLSKEAHAMARFGKPFLWAEFGIDWQTGDNRWDPKGTGLNMHNGAWAAMLSGTAGTAMLWYWDSYVHPLDTYHVLTPVRKFADTVDWANARLQPLENITVETSSDQPETFTDLTIPATQEWGTTASNEYTVLRNGEVRGGPVAMTIGSLERKPGELFSSLTWHVDLPKASKVVARLGQVSSKGQLRITLDGKNVLDRPLATGEPGKGPWKAAHFQEQWKIWVSDYDEDIAIDVSAGKHDITFTNVAGDWLQIRSITLPSYRSSRYPDLDVLGLQSRSLLLLWLHNPQSTWRTEFDGKQPGLQNRLRVNVPVPTNGTWKVEWWDTFTGQVIRRDDVPAMNQHLQVTPPDFARDLAVQITKH